MDAEVVVVGAGLVGSAVARHLAEQGANVVCIDAPAGAPPFSSHDDDTRITRVLHESIVWAELARRSIAAYQDIEQRSGARFHHPVGVMWMGARPSGLAALGRVLEDFAVRVEDSPSPWAGDLLLPSTDVELFERGGAGFIEPRRMRSAQISLARKAGAGLVPGVAVGFERSGGGWSVRLTDGGTVTGERVVVSAGASLGFATGVDVQPTAQAVLLVEVPASVGRRWSARPCVGRLNAETVDFYFTPPQDLGGRWVMKVGSEPEEDLVLASPEEVTAWMSGEMAGSHEGVLEEKVRRVFPDLDVVGTVTRRCMYARTPRRHPLVRELEPGFVLAGGGNGRAAKSSDALGALAASFVASGEWTDPLPYEEFGG